RIVPDAITTTPSVCSYPIRGYATKPFQSVGSVRRSSVRGLPSATPGALNGGRFGTTSYVACH
ncbi:hypothetical protein, partial [Acinetobacter baumannii]|uniref:hypothetical protein n=1 Tax=Acinetobacter baumannii TaxID=470 RepID=UPI001C06C3AF